MRMEKIMVFVSVGLLLAGCGEVPSDKYSRGGYLSRKPR